MTSRLALIILAVSSFLATDASAFGPGTHSREAKRTFDRLAAIDPDWAALESTPYFRAYLALGSIAPDFKFVSESLDWGHSRALSYHLLDEAESQGDAAKRLFALGHLCHNASDSSAEGFVINALFSSAPIGPFDLFAGDVPYKEAEGIVESFGDLYTGDWRLVVDLLYDLRLDGDEAWQRFVDMFGWYCEQGAQVLGKPTDCQAVIAEIGQALSQADALLGLFGRADAHAFIQDLIDGPAEVALDLILGESFAGIMGDAGFVLSDEFDIDIARVKRSALVDRSFWALYDDALADIGPSFALELMGSRRGSGWPTYNARAIDSGILSSMLRFLPNEYDVVTGLSVDEVVWRDAEGTPVEALDNATFGALYTVSVRFFSALPLVGIVKGVVKADRPGIDRADDPIIGIAQMPVAIDPEAYERVNRDILEVNFVPRADDGALGYYLELSVNAGRPTFTTNWDRLWTIGEFDFERSLFADNFGTYGHWPPSLPVNEPPNELARLFVKVRRAPAGAGVPEVRVSAQDRVVGTGASGVAFLGDLQPGPVTVTADATGWAGMLPVDTELVAGQVGWVSLIAHAIPAFSAPAGWLMQGECVPFEIAVSPFGDQVESFDVGLIGEADGEVIGAVTTDESGQGEICPATPLSDGTRVRLEALATYHDGSEGVPGVSEVFGVDETPPELIVGEPIVAGSPPCTNVPLQEPYRPRASVDFTVFEPHSVVTQLAWRIDEQPWTAMGADSEGRGQVVIDEHIGASVSFRAGNQAGGVTEVSVQRPTVALSLCEEPDAGPGVADAPIRGGSGGGCTSGAPGAGGWWLALLVVCAARRRRVGHGSC